LIAVGSLIIALQPAGAKGLMIGLFGTKDKLALNVALVLVALLVATALGMVARRNFAFAVLAFVAFGAVSLVGAVYVEVVPWPPALLSAGVAVLAAAGTLRLLLNLAAEVAVTVETPANPFRRRFLISSIGLLVSAVLAGSLGRYLLARSHPTGVPVGAAKLPESAATVPTLTADEQLSAPGLSPLVVPNDVFYRIDTSLLVPVIDASTWQLKISGMVDNPRTYSYQDLEAMPLIEQYITLVCVSNDVGGDLVGNALWTGVRLKEVLGMAGVRPGATQIVGRAIDGFTVGFPTSWALDPAREAMIAMSMNREPLPAEHGYPARLIVPGQYGYVSATKWLTEIELTTREAFNAFWINLGWAKDGPILTQSRIDHPQYFDEFPSGPTWVDGVAWAPDRGIARVEVRIDDGTWNVAEMSRPISKATWVQWMWLWQADPGVHHIEVRATDGTGQVQTAEQTNAEPNGARGHHRIKVTVD
jgi:DMSO/TMAO reductase YedYZ molybdopterin-dependent catalytic subunit